MAGNSARLNSHFARASPEAAKAGRLVMDYVLGLDDAIDWKLNKLTVDFRAIRPFCSLWPVRDHVTLSIVDEGTLHDPTNRLEGAGRAKHVKLRAPSDVDATLKALLRQAYSSVGLVPRRAMRKR